MKSKKEDLTSNIHGDKKIQQLSLAGLFLALSIVLPILTGGIPKIGNMLTPMHIPVILAGYISGPYWGMAVGFAAPLLRSAVFAAPPLIPKAISMSLELACYAFVSGKLYAVFPKKKRYVYISLVIAMICGRIVWGLSRLAFAGITGSSFTYSAFIAGALLEALPGIAIQLILIPAVVFFYRSHVSNPIYDNKCSK